MGLRNIGVAKDLQQIHVPWTNEKRDRFLNATKLNIKQIMWTLVDSKN